MALLHLSPHLYNITSPYLQWIFRTAVTGAVLEKNQDPKSWRKKRMWTMATWLTELCCRRPILLITAIPLSNLPNSQIVGILTFLQGNQLLWVERGKAEEKSHEEDMGSTGRERRVSEKGLLREHHTWFLLNVSARQSDSSKSLFSLSSICSYDLKHIVVCLTEWSPSPASILGASHYTTKNTFPSITGWGPRMDLALCWSTLLNQTIVVLHFIAFDNKTSCNVMQKLKMRKELKVYLSNEESYW